ncbi:MAG: peptidase M19, partial [Phototrophicales bacterium]
QRNEDIAMFLIDAHQDIAYNAVCFKRDYRVSALKKRQQEHESINGAATLGLPEALVGRVALVFATIFTAPRSKSTQPWSPVMYETAQQAYQQGMTQLDYYHRITDEDARLRLIRTASDLDAVLSTWESDKSIKERVQGLVLLMENADPILEPKQFEAWYEAGVRIVGPAWQASRYCGGTGAPGGLTQIGHELLDVMRSLNAILDLSHMAEQAYFEALDQYDGVIIASHSNPRHFCNTDRHLSDEMIRALAERDGVIGAVLYNKFLRGGWTVSDGKHSITLTTVVDVIDHICQVTGSAQHVGIGTDFDGGFGAEATPAEIDTIADLWLLKDALIQRGFGEDDVANILGGNMLRQLRKSLKG